MSNIQRKDLDTATPLKKEAPLMMNATNGDNGDHQIETHTVGDHSILDMNKNVNLQDRDKEGGSDTEGEIGFATGNNYNSNVKLMKSNKRTNGDDVEDITEMKGIALKKRFSE